MVEKKIRTPVLLFLGSAAFALLLQFFSAFHSQQHGDSLMVSIMSTTRPTMFYWGQDQWLNLLPWLFSFIKDPGLNLFFITLAQFLYLFLFPYLAAGLLPVRRKCLFWAVSVLSMALLGRPFLLEAAFQPYSLALFVALMGLRLAKAGMFGGDGKPHLGTCAISAMLGLVAVRVAEPVFVFIVVGMGWFAGSGLDVRKHESRWIADSITLRRQMTRLGQWCVLFLLMYAVSAAFPRWLKMDFAHRSMLISPDPVKALRTLMAMALNFERFYDRAHLFAGTIALGTLGGSIVLAIRRRTDVLWISGILFVLPALIIAAAMSSLEWVRLNDSFPRYLFIPIFLLLLNFAFLTERVTADLVLSSRVISFTQAGFAMGAATLIFLAQKPSPYQPIRERIRSSLKDQAVFESGAGRHGAIGDYWRVWPFVWTRKAYGDADFIGISFRSNSIKDLINRRLFAAKPFELMALGDDKEVEPLLDSWSLPKDIQSVQVGSARIIRGFMASPGRTAAIEVTDIEYHRR